MRARLLRRGVRLCLLILGVVPSRARGSVSLFCTDGDDTPTSTIVAQGDSFPVTVKLTSTSASSADQVVEVSYRLQSSVGGVMTLASRNSTGSTFADTYSTDAAVAGLGLNPREDFDLGGTELSVYTAVSNGTFQVADYTLTVGAAVTPGVYTLSTFSYPGSGYAGAFPTFDESSFSSPGSFTVTVIPSPEPTCLALGAVGAVGILGRRRRRA